MPQNGGETSVGPWWPDAYNLANAESCRFGVRVLLDARARLNSVWRVFADFAQDLVYVKRYMFVRLGLQQITKYRGRDRWVFAEINQ